MDVQLKRLTNLDMTKSIYNYVLNHMLGEHPFNNKYGFYIWITIIYGNNNYNKKMCSVPIYGLLFF